MRLDRGREHSVSVFVLKKGEAVYKETVGGKISLLVSVLAE